MGISMTCSFLNTHQKAKTRKLDRSCSFMSIEMSLLSMIEVGNLPVNWENANMCVKSDHNRAVWFQHNCPLLRFSGDVSVVLPLTGAFLAAYARRHPAVLRAWNWANSPGIQRGCAPNTLETKTRCPRIWGMLSSRPGSDANIPHIG